MSQLAGIPVPSVEQIIVGSELVLILLPVRMLANAMQNELRKERNRIIKHHVKNGHYGRFKHCLEGDCSSLQSLGQPQLGAAQSQVEIELID